MVAAVEDEDKATEGSSWPIARAAAKQKRKPDNPMKTQSNTGKSDSAFSGVFRKKKPKKRSAKEVESEYVEASRVTRTRLARPFDR